MHWLAHDIRSSLRLARTEGLTSVLRALPGYASKRVSRARLPERVTDIRYRGATVSVLPARSTCEYELYRHGVYEPEVEAAISRTLTAGETALDVGAHVGHHTVSMREAVGADGRVLAFEPERSRMAVLERTVAANDYANVDLFEAGVSDHRGTASLDRSGVPTLREAEGADVVSTVVLDDLLDARELDRVGLVKMDIEGHESRALAGLSPDRVDTLLLEVHPRLVRAADGRAGVDALFDHLDAYRTVTDLETGTPVKRLRGVLEGTERRHLCCTSR